MRDPVEGVKWLLVDGCGAVATMAVGYGELVLGEAEMPGRSFSAGWPAALRELLVEVGFEVRQLAFVGVVNGPGSFTGVRVGLAAAKGLCEATGARLIGMSRLEVLSSYGSVDGLAVLEAGRGEFYVRDGGCERLTTAEELAAAAVGREVVALDESVASLLGGSVKLLRMEASSALRIALGRWSAGDVDDVSLLDANYVRGEKEIYAKKPAAGAHG